MATTTESSAMFSLAMLTKEALHAPAEPVEAPAPSLPHVFAPVLAVPVPDDVKMQCAMRSSVGAVCGG